MIDELRKLRKWEKSASSRKFQTATYSKYKGKRYFWRVILNGNPPRVEHLQNSRAMNFVTGWMNPAQKQHSSKCGCSHQPPPQQQYFQTAELPDNICCHITEPSSPHLFCIKKRAQHQQYRCHFYYIPHILVVWGAVARNTLCVPKKHKWVALITLLPACCLGGKNAVACS